MFFHFSRPVGRRLCVRTVLGWGKLEQEGEGTAGIAPQDHVHGNARHTHIRHKYDRKQIDARLRVSGLQKTIKNGINVRVRIASQVTKGYIRSPLDI